MTNPDAIQCAGCTNCGATHSTTRHVTDRSPIPRPATPGPVDVATVRFIADALEARETYESRLIAQRLRAALAALPPQQQDVPREWGVRHGDDCDLGIEGVEEPFEPWTEEKARSIAAAWRERGHCSTATVWSRTPGGVWEPVEQEEVCACDGKPILSHEDGMTRGLCEHCDSVRCDAYPGACKQAAPDRFSVAEIEAAWRVAFGATHVTRRTDFLAALRAGRGES